MRHHGLADGWVWKQQYQTVITHIGRKIGQGIDAMHAGQFQRRVLVDRRKTRMGMRASDKDRMQHVGHADVIGKLALSGQKCGVFQPLDRRAK